MISEVMTDAELGWPEPQPGAETMARAAIAPTRPERSVDLVKEAMMRIGTSYLSWELH